jgi:hypothetical protein
MDIWDQMALESEPATPEKKRDTYERVRLRVRLEVRDGVKLAHVVCTVGEETLTVGSVKNVTPCRRCRSSPRRSRRPG